MKIIYAANIRVPTEKAHGAQVMHAVASLRERGCDVELVVPTRRNTILDDPFIYYGIKTLFPIKRVFSFDTVSFGRIGFLFQTLSFAIRAALYALHNEKVVFYTRDEIVAAVAIIFGKKNVFWESHDGSWNWFARFTAKHVAGMATVTKGGKDFYVQNGIPQSKILVLPNGVALEDFKTTVSKQEARNYVQISHDTFVALYVGALDGWKGVTVLCEASKFLPDEIAVVVVGGYEAEIAKYKKNYPKVIFTGSRPFSELPKILSAADVLVIPNTARDRVSYTFTCPLKLLAYMAAGKPIIASDIPSIREITGTHSALLVEADNPSAISDAIIRLINNPEQGAIFASTAKKHIQKFSWEKRAEKVFIFLDSLV